MDINAEIIIMAIAELHESTTVSRAPWPPPEHPEYMDSLDEDVPQPDQQGEGESKVTYSERFCRVA